MELSELKKEDRQNNFERKTRCENSYGKEVLREVEREIMNRVVFSLTLH